MAGEQTKNTVGDNATLKYSLTGPAGTMTLVSPDVVDITPGKRTIPEVAKPKLGSKSKASQPGKTVDEGDIAITYPYTPASVTLVNGWIDTQAIPDFQLAIDDLTTPSKLAFPGWVKEYEPFSGTLNDGKQEIMCSRLVIKTANTPTFTAGS